MKSIVLIGSILFLSSFADAWPGVGNWNKFVITSKDLQSGTENTQTSKFEFIEFKPKTKTWKVKRTTRVPNDPNEYIGYYEQSNITQTKDSLSQMVKDCELYYGILETVVVPAGSFLACRVQSQGAGGLSVDWYSEFGGVKTISTWNRVKTTWILEDFYRAP